MQKGLNQMHNKPHKFQENTVVSIPISGEYYSTHPDKLKMAVSHK